jgi:hypothetical protein
MADLTLSFFSAPLRTFSSIPLAIDVVETPFLPVGEEVAVLEEIRTRGQSGYRSRIVHGQPRRVLIRGFAGASSIAAARTKAEQFQRIDGSYGDAIFTQASATVTWKHAQVVQISAQPVNARLSSASFDYDYCVRLSLVLVLNQ